MLNFLEDSNLSLSLQTKLPDILWMLGSLRMKNVFEVYEHSYASFTEDSQCILVPKTRTAGSSMTPNNLWFFPKHKTHVWFISGEKTGNCFLMLQKRKTICVRLIEDYIVFDVNVFVLFTTLGTTLSLMFLSTQPHNFITAHFPSTENEMDFLDRENHLTSSFFAAKSPRMLHSGHRLRSGSLGAVGEKCRTGVSYCMGPKSRNSHKTTKANLGPD